MLILRPCPQLNEMALQPINRITEWPRGRLRTGAVAGWIIRCRMPLGTIGEKLDQGRPKTCTRAGGGTMRHGVNGPKIVPVDTYGRNPNAQTARGERRRRPSRYPRT